MPTPQRNPQVWTAAAMLTKRGNYFQPDGTLKFEVRSTDANSPYDGEPFPWDVHFTIAADADNVRVVGVSITAKEADDGRDVTGQVLSRVPIAWLREEARRELELMHRVGLSGTDGRHLARIFPTGVERTPREYEGPRSPGRPREHDDDFAYVVAKAHLDAFEKNNQSVRGYMAIVAESLGRELRRDGQPVPEGTLKAWRRFCNTEGFLTRGRYPQPGPNYLAYEQQQQSRKGRRK